MDNSLKCPLFNKVSSRTLAMLCGSKARYLTEFLLPKSGCKYSCSNSYIFAMTRIIMGHLWADSTKGHFKGHFSFHTKYAFVDPTWPAL